MIDLLKSGERRLRPEEFSMYTNTRREFLMIKIILVVCASLFLGMSFGAAAQDGVENGEMSAEKLCGQIADDYAVSRDTCVACVNGGESAPECICESFDEEALTNGRLENFDQCVKVFGNVL